MNDTIQNRLAAGTVLLALTLYAALMAFVLGCGGSSKGEFSGHTKAIFPDGTVWERTSSNWGEVHGPPNASTPSSLTLGPEGGGGIIGGTWKTEVDRLVHSYNLMTWAGIGFLIAAAVAQLGFKNTGWAAGLGVIAAGLLFAPKFFESAGPVITVLLVIGGLLALVWWLGGKAWAKKLKDNNLPAAAAVARNGNPGKAVDILRATDPRVNAAFEADKKKK